MNRYHDRQARALIPSSFIILLMAILSLSAIPALSFSQESHLQTGIRLFEDGQYNEALAEFNDQIETNPRCPLAYYYAARIRVARKQFDRAEKNLATAFRDSSGFHEARALMAVVLLNLGNEKGALAEWDKFIAVEGALSPGSTSTVGDIMLPEEFRAIVETRRLEAERQEKLAAEKREQERLAAEKRERERIEAERKEQERIAVEKREKERLAAEKREKERLAAEEKARLEVERKKREVAEQLEARRAKEEQAAKERHDREEQLAAERAAKERAAAETAVSQAPPQKQEVMAEGKQAPPMDDNAVAAPIDDIGQRIRSTIRRGVYGIGVIALVLAAITAWVVYVTRKRRAAREESGFPEEVERMMVDREFELSDEQAIRELEERKKGIITEARNIMSPEIKPERTPEPSQAEPVPEKVQESPRKTDASENTRDTMITEEVKGLVSRLYREGKRPEEIANIADLTKTEVNLILAVRERHLSDLIEDIHEEDNNFDRDELLEAINTLVFEGAGTREIARKLNISLSEVELASSVLELRKQTSL